MKRVLVCALVGRVERDLLYVAVILRSWIVRPLRRLIASDAVGTDLKDARAKPLFLPL